MAFLVSLAMQMTYFQSQEGENYTAIGSKVKGRKE